MNPHARALSHRLEPTDAEAGSGGTLALGSGPYQIVTTSTSHWPNEMLYYTDVETKRVGTWAFEANDTLTKWWLRSCASAPLETNTAGCDEDDAYVIMSMCGSRAPGYALATSIPGHRAIFGQSPTCTAGGISCDLHASYVWRVLPASAEGTYYIVTTSQQRPNASLFMSPDGLTLTQSDSWSAWRLVPAARHSCAVGSYAWGAEVYAGIVALSIVPCFFLCLCCGACLYKDDCYGLCREGDRTPPVVRRVTSPQVRHIARQASGSVSTAGAAVARQMPRLQGRPVSDAASGAAPVTVVEGVAVQIEQGSDGDAPR